MGTSQKYKASVKGQPNWGGMTSSMMALAASEEKDEELTQDELVFAEEESALQEEEQKKNPQKEVPLEHIQKRKTLDRRRRKLNIQLANNLKNAVIHSINAAGGKQAVTSGRSLAFGSSGVNSIYNFVSNITKIVEVGLDTWLRNHNCGDLASKTTNEVVEIITNYSHAELAPIDSTAAAEALETLKELLNEKLGDDKKLLDEKLTNILVPGEMAEFVDIYFADYLYGHLSTSVFERLERKYTPEKAMKLMGKIKDHIREDVKGLQNEQKAAKIAWESQEGKDFLQHEFNRIINIYVGDDNNN
jgi:hypothetical protein